MTLDLSDPLVAQELVRIVDRRVAERLELLLDRRQYGIVEAVAGGKASVRLHGGVDVSPGFAYPLHSPPAVGERVRVVTTPTRDRYVDDVLGRLSVIRHGVTATKTTTQTMATTGAFDQITGFTGTVLTFGGATWNEPGAAAGSIHTTEPGIYFMSLTGRFVNATSGQRHGLGIYVTATSGGVAGGSTPALHHTDIRSQAITANHYLVLSTVGMVSSGDRWWYPMYWQSSGATHTIDGVVFQILKIGEYPV